MKYSYNGNGTGTAFEEDDRLGAQKTHGHTGKKEPRNPRGAGLKRRTTLSLSLTDEEMEQIKMASILLGVSLSEMARHQLAASIKPYKKYIDAAIEAKRALQRVIHLTQR